jgi:hypothetical protein
VEKSLIAFAPYIPRHASGSNLGGLAITMNFSTLVYNILFSTPIVKNLLHSLGLVYKSMRGMMTNSIDRDQWLNVTSESRDRIWPFFLIILNFALGRNRTRDPPVAEPKRTLLGYILKATIISITSHKKNNINF